MRFRRFIRQAHRWLGLLIGVQVLLWIFGGTVMSMLRLEEVRGEHLAVRKPPQALDGATALIPLADVMRQHAARQPATITLSTLLGQPVYLLSGGGETWLLDAVTGAVLSPLPREKAEAIARADYAGDAPVLIVEWVDAAATEYRGHDLPLWRVRFGDERATALYVSPDSGKIVARRNDLWRLFDFVWMLHIMDYEERENFNHPLLLIAATTALLFALTGLTMLFYSFRPRRSAPEA